MSSPFTKILVKIRINPKKAAKLAAAMGISVVTISNEQRDAQISAHMDARGSSHYQRHGLRNNAAGERVGDSGKPVFGFEGARHEAVSLLALNDDLVAAGYRLSIVTLKQKPRDNMVNLELCYLSDKGQEEAELTHEGIDLINAELARCFGHCHVWDNRTSFGSATVNMAHAIGDDSLQAITDPRFLRFSVDQSGNPHWTNERGTLPKTATAQVAEAAQA